MAIEKIEDKEALEYIKSKRLLQGYSYEDVWKEEHSRSFTVAKCMSDDLLTDIQNSLAENIAKGTSYNEWAKNIEKTMTDKGWWGRKEMTDPLTGETKEVQLGSPRRLKTIYNVNMRQARSVGNYERGQSSKYHTKMMYRIGNSKKHREEHLRWDGLILPRDDPWWDTHMPPNGYNCKCTVKFLTEAAAQEYEKKGKIGNSPIKTKAPEDIIEQYTNKRTGKTYQGVKGITPGFEYNPANAKKNEERTQELFKQAELGYQHSYRDVKNLQAAKDKFPVVYNKTPQGYWVAEGRKPAAHEKAQAEIMIDKGYVVTMLPENSADPSKKCDAVVDGVFTEFKNVTGSCKKVGKRFAEGLLQGKDIFIRIHQDISETELYSKLLGELNKTPRDYGKVYFYLESKKKFFIWDIKKLNQEAQEQKKQS